MDSLTRGIKRACALHLGIRGVSVSSIMATKIASFFKQFFLSGVGRERLTGLEPPLLCSINSNSA